MVVEYEEVLEKVNKILRNDCKNMSFVETIESLVYHIEKVDKEFILMSQSIAEDDVIIQQLQEDVEKGKYANNENCRLRKELWKAEDRIKELEDHAHTISKHPFETRFVKAGYMDLDD